MKFFYCIVYIISTGIVFFLLGRALPKEWFHEDAPLYRPRKNESRLFQKLKIKEWQKRLPDMSRIAKKLMPAKKLTEKTLSDLNLMIEETCVAEFIHVLLCISGLACLRIWPGTGGKIVTVLYILLGNVPYILVQRYTRPRLEELRHRREMKTKTEGSIAE